MNQLNNTYYLKLIEILSLKTKNIPSKCKEEQQNILEKTEQSLWGLTDAHKEYLDILNQISYITKKNFKSFRLKQLKRKINKKFDKKIRVVFFCYEYQTFPTFKSTYEKIKNNNNFKCELVHIPFYHTDKSYNEKSEIDEYLKNGYKEIIKSSEYKLTNSSPDVAFFLKPYDLIPKEYYIDEIKKVIDKSIYIPYGMEIGATVESYRYQFQLPLHDEAWMCVSYCNEHYKRACKYSSQKGKNYKLIGHPRMDLVHCDLTNEKDYKKIKKQANNRKIFMWNTHFTIADGDNWGTFKYYGLDILKYFANHKELFLLYRPHPFFKEALEKQCDSKILTEYEDILLKNKDNIYVDTSGNYLISMHVSDVLISDATSFIPEYLIYNKPIIYTKKPNTSGFKNRELESMLYTCNGKEDIFNNIESLKEGKDPLLSKRKKSIEKTFHFNSNTYVADKIIEYIIDYFNKEEIE